MTLRIFYILPARTHNDLHTYTHIHTYVRAHTSAQNSHNFHRKTRICARNGCEMERVDLSMFGWMDGWPDKWMAAWLHGGAHEHTQTYSMQAAQISEYKYVCLSVAKQPDEITSGRIAEDEGEEDLSIWQRLQRIPQRRVSSEKHNHIYIHMYACVCVVVETEKCYLCRVSPTDNSCNSQKVSSTIRWIGCLLWKRLLAKGGSLPIQTYRYMNLWLVNDNSCENPCIQTYVHELIHFYY